MYVSVYMSIMCLAVYIQYIPYVVHCIIFNVYGYMHCCSIDILCWVADTVGVGRLTAGGWTAKVYYTVIHIVITLPVYTWTVVNVFIRHCSFILCSFAAPNT